MKQQIKDTRFESDTGLVRDNGCPPVQRELIEEVFSQSDQPVHNADNSTETNEAAIDKIQPICSVFSKGYRNKKGKAVMQNCPERTMPLFDIHAYIINPENAELETAQLRELSDKPMQRDFKLLNFKYATFCGVFKYRKAEYLQEESALMVVDIDGMQNLEAAKELKCKLCADKHYETALCFISPSGYGVKWVVERQPLEGKKYRDEISRMYNYVAFEYGIAIDTSGSDICRACYLPYDKDCYINKKYIK